MTRLTHPGTGHSLEAADKASVEFWTAAGYAPEKGAKAAPAKKPAKKAAAKKSAAKAKK